jgi:hypothetical protein
MFSISSFMIYQNYNHSHDIFIGSWIKKYKKDGKFIRIWDYPINYLTKDMKKDIIDVIDYIYKKKKSI